MHISDTLSRASLPLTDDKTSSADYQIFQVREQQSFQEELEEIDMEEALFVTDSRLEKIRYATTNDSTLQTLMSVVEEGWPDSKAKVPLCIREYWPYRDELSTQNGLVYRGTRIIIPAQMRPEMIIRAHASHLGIQYTTGTAREIMYWPRMTTDLAEAVFRCSTCQEAQSSQQREPMMSCPIPQLPWQAVASDCFELEEEHYVVLVDLYSDFIEVAHLPDMSTKTPIQQMKPILATHGTPALLITDNGTNYSSQEFKEFTQAWDINHITTSPHHPKSNGKAESAVKIIKGIISKAKKEGMDMWKCILEWRNSPTPGTSSSPSQRLMSRRTRSMLPCSQTMYKPEVQTTVTEQIIRKRKQAKYYHDRQAKSLPKLVIGQPVRVKVHPQQPRSSWRPGTVESTTPAPRSYIVKVDGRKYRRNRIHIRDSFVSKPNPSLTREAISPTASTQSNPRKLLQRRSNNVQAQPQDTDKKGDVEEPEQVPPRTRYGRVIKPPERLKDFIK